MVLTRFNPGPLPGIGRRRRRHSVVIVVVPRRRCSPGLPDPSAEELHVVGHLEAPQHPRVLAIAVGGEPVAEDQRGEAETRVPEQLAQVEERPHLVPE